LSVPSGTWAKIPKPGEDYPDTPDARVEYIADVANAVPGEPRINARAAKPLLERLRAALAKNALVSPASISVVVGDSAASIKIAGGVQAAVRNVREGGRPVVAALCSEMFLPVSLMTAGLSTDDFAKAGVRGLLCMSDGCSAVLDMRPTAPGGGVYGGDACVGLSDVLPSAPGSP